MPTWNEKLSEWWDNSLTNQMFVKPITDFGSMVGQALDAPAGAPGSVWEIDQETGEVHVGQRPTEAAASAAMTIPLAGLASTGGRASQLASGPLLDSLKWKLESHANQLGMSVDDLAENVMNNPENWPSLTDSLGPHIEAAAGETYGKPPPLEHDYYDLPEAAGQLPSPPSQIDLAQKPYYGTGSQAMDDLIAKADEKGWNPHTLAGKYTAGELDEHDLHYHSLVDAGNVPKGSLLEPLVKGYGQPAVDPLAPKPLDTKKYPWLAPSVDPYGNSEFLNPRRDAVFRPYVEAAHMMDIDIRDEISTLFKEGPEYEATKEAADSRLRDIRGMSESLPPRSPVVPWAFNTRDPNWEAKAGSLTLSDETKAKAAAMGFDPEQIYWKGTKYPEQRMLDPSTKPNAPALYFSDKPDVGPYYGDWIYPTLLKMENPAVRDMAGSQYSEGWMKRFVQDSLAAGHESAIAKNMRDSGGIQTQYMVTHPRQVRSVFAAFDPKRAAEGDLLAAGNVPFNPFDFLAQTEEQKRRNAY